MTDSSNTTNSLAHTKWNCKYHIVFAPKYRRKVFYDEHRAEVREILRKLCEWKGVEIIEFERQERDDNISKVWKHEVRIPKSRILV